MKKVLVLSLVLVMVLAASAMASNVNFRGWYQLELDNDDDFALKGFAMNHRYELNLDVSTEQSGRWKLEGRLGRFTQSGAVGSFSDYRLQIWEGDVKIDVANRNLSWINTPLNVIRINRGDGPLVRAEFPLADYADMEVQYNVGKRITSIARFDVSDNPVGLAFEHNFSGVDAVNTVVGFGNFKVSDVTIQGGVGYTLNTPNTDGMHVAVKAETKLNDEVKVDAMYRQVGTEYGIHNSNHDSSNNNRELEANLTYDIPNIQVRAGFKTTGTAADFTQDEVSASLSYFTANNPNWNQLVSASNANLPTFNDTRHQQFDNNRWLKRVQGVRGFATQLMLVQRMPKAVGADNTLIVTGRVASPIVDDMVWGFAHTDYNFETSRANVRAGLSAKVTDSLSLYPKVNYTVNKGADDSAQFNLQAQYEIGNRWIGLNVGQKFIADDDKFAALTIRVGF